MVASRYTLSIFIWILSGYSFKSNEYGLAIDNVVAYELVLPNGTVRKVTADDHDLWFALRVRGRQLLSVLLTEILAGRWEQLCALLRVHRIRRLKLRTGYCNKIYDQVISAGPNMGQSV